jgi:hypothetical protein
LDPRPQPQAGQDQDQRRCRTRLIQLACSDPPEGRCHWTLQPLRWAPGNRGHLSPALACLPRTASSCLTGPGTT